MAVLTPYSWLVATALLFCTVTAFRYVKSYTKLSHIPGPRLAAWSNVWWIRAALSKKGHLHLYEACEKYGIELAYALRQMKLKLNRPACTNRAQLVGYKRYRLDQKDELYENTLPEK